MENLDKIFIVLGFSLAFFLILGGAHAKELTKLTITLNVDEFGLADVSEEYLYALNPEEIEPFKEAIKENASAWYKWVLYDKQITFHVGNQLTDLRQTYMTSSFEDSGGRTIAKLLFNYKTNIKVAKLKNETKRLTQWELKETNLNIDKAISIKIPYYMVLKFVFPKKAEIEEVLPLESTVSKNTVIIYGPLSTNAFSIKYSIAKDITPAFDLSSLWQNILEEQNKYYLFGVLLALIALIVWKRKELTDWVDELLIKYSKINYNFEELEEYSKK